MRPAPAAKRASRTVSSDSRGTNTTSLRFRGALQGLRRRTLELVDLRALQLARVVHVDGLPLSIEVERCLPRLAMSVAGCLRAAERQVHLRTGRARVDVRDPRVQVAHRTERLVHVAREDRRRQAELD